MWSGLLVEPSQQVAEVARRGGAVDVRGSSRRQYRVLNDGNANPEEGKVDEGTSTEPRMTKVSESDARISQPSATEPASRSRHSFRSSQLPISCKCHERRLTNPGAGSNRPRSRPARPGQDVASTPARGDFAS